MNQLKKIELIPLNVNCCERVGLKIPGILLITRYLCFLLLIFLTFLKLLLKPIPEIQFNYSLTTNIMMIKFYKAGASAGNRFIFELHIHFSPL